jgi:glucan endo-1,6-beta-glucosidase
MPIWPASAVHRFALFITFADVLSADLPRVQNDAALRNSPLYFGEWAVTTNFNTSATDEFLNKWADAQKLAYTKGKGWVYWNFKTEEYDAEGNELARQW